MRITPYGAAKRPNQSKTRSPALRRKAYATMAHEPSVTMAIAAIKTNTSVGKNILELQFHESDRVEISTLTPSSGHKKCLCFPTKTRIERPNGEPTLIPAQYNTARVAFKPTAARWMR